MNLNMNVLSLKTPTPSTSDYPGDPNKYYISFSNGYIITTVTCRSSTASEWVQQITELYGSSPTVVGLAAEWMSQPNMVATLQLCIENSCLILQMQHLDKIPEPIRRFLKNPNFTFVGVELCDTMNKLLVGYGLGCTLSKDVGFQAKLHHPKIFSQPMPGLRELAGVLCGWWLENPEQQTVLHSDWKALRLSDAQVEYASIQAFVSLRIGECLQFISARSSQ